MHVDLSPLLLVESLTDAVETLTDAASEGLFTPSEGLFTPSEGLFFIIRSTVRTDLPVVRRSIKSQKARKSLKSKAEVVFAVRS